MKGDDSFSVFIEKLFKNYVVDDVEEISLPKIAFSLNYYSYDVDEISTYEVSFVELKKLHAGDVIKAHHKYNDEFYYEEIARIIYLDDFSAVIRIEITDKTKNHLIEDGKLIHVKF